MADSEAETRGKAALGISDDEARGIANLLRYAVSLNTTAGLLSPTERRLTTPTYRAVELAAQVLEGKSFEEAVKGAEKAWTGSLELDHQHALDLLNAHRDALQRAMSGRMSPERFAEYLEISQDQFLELVRSELHKPPSRER